MNLSNIQATIATELRNLALVLNADITKEAIMVHAKMYSKHDLDSVKNAIVWASENCIHFPKPVELLSRINPKPGTMEANHLAGNIIQGITRFGIYQATEAQANLGPLAWRAVNYAGGWRALCNTPPENLGTLRAQLRSFCETSLNAPQIEKNLKIIEGKVETNLLQFKNPAEIEEAK